MIWRALLRRDAEQAFLAMPILRPEATVLTDACAGPSAAPGCAWASGCGVGGIGPDGEWFSEELPVELFPWTSRRLHGGNISGPAEMLASVLALRLWGPRASAGGADSMIAFPLGTDNLANTFVCGKLYTSRPPLSWCLRELALTAVHLRALPVALHVPGATSVAPDRLSRGFNSYPSIRALGLGPGKRRRAE